MDRECRWRVVPTFTVHSALVEGLGLLARMCVRESGVGCPAESVAVSNSHAAIYGWFESKPRHEQIGMNALNIVTLLIASRVGFIVEDPRPDAPVEGWQASAT